MFKMLLLAACLLAIAACAEQETPRTPTPGGAHVYTFNIEFYGAATASVEERIYLADVVVRATFTSTADDLLTFTVVEYLKGMGPDTIKVNAETDGRPTTWDGQEAVLFLKNTSSSARSTSAASFEFTDTTVRDYAPGVPDLTYTGPLPEGYTVDSRNPVWVPGGGSAAAKSSTAQSRDYDLGSGESISLDHLRDKVDWVTGAAGVAGYDSCVRAGLVNIRTYRDWEAFYGAPRPRRENDIAIGSGAARVLFEAKNTDAYPPYKVYRNRWIEGPYKDLFSAEIVDDDTDPANGHREVVKASRPLPAGTYRFLYRAQSPGDLPCNYVSEHAGAFWDVTVTAPAGTLHEALFDPAAIGAAVGADTANGVVEPGGFTVGGTATTLQALKWRSGVVTWS